VSEKSTIGWTEATWNPVTGCSKVSPGCAHCYAETLSLRFGTSKLPWTPENAAEHVVMHPERLDLPLTWRKPRMVFVNSMSDLFHELVPDEFIDRIFATMALAKRHTFQVLTKRPDRMTRYFSETCNGGQREAHVYTDAEQLHRGIRKASDPWNVRWPGWPLPNVWLGVSVENQRWADARIPLLLETPAAVRFLSCEPLLGPLDLKNVRKHGQMPDGEALDVGFDVLTGRTTISNARTPSTVDWVIVGGESGNDRRQVKRWLVERCCRMGSPFGPPQLEHGEYRPKETVCAAYNAGDCDLSNWQPKPEALAWVRAILDQCVAAGVPFFFKQWGGPTHNSGGRVLDGRTWDEMPAREPMIA